MTDEIKSLASAGRPLLEVSYHLSPLAWEGVAAKAPLDREGVYGPSKAKGPHPRGGQAEKFGEEPLEDDATRHEDTTLRPPARPPTHQIMASSFELTLGSSCILVIVGGLYQNPWCAGI